jgi:hypothetical protein
MPSHIDYIAEIFAGLASLVAAVTGIVNMFKNQSIHVMLNSRLSELLQLTKTSSHAEGVKDEKERAP